MEIGGFSLAVELILNSEQNKFKVLAVCSTKNQYQRQ